MEGMDEVFKALNDPSRRLLLDKLFEEDGQTLGELTEHLPQMTRFGVMNHLSVLETAGLITTRKVGRSKHHYLNPIPIRLAHDRWISKYTEPVIGAMASMKTHLEGGTRTMPEPTHIYQTYIQCDPEDACLRRCRVAPLSRNIQRSGRAFLERVWSCQSASCAWPRNRTF